MNDMSTSTSMISSEKVEGTAVFGAEGSEIGQIHHLMIDKHSGNVAYAVMSFGGFLGLGEDYHAIPWRALRYNPDIGGYVTDLTERQLSGAPERKDDWYRDREWEKRTYDHYGINYYWL